MRFALFDWVENHPHLSAGQVYAHKLELAAAADRAGFHAMFLAEHQGTPLSIDGAPSVLLSAIFQRTQRLRAGALCWCLPWHNPYRLYSEVCMLDHLSGGRVEMGVGRGVSPIESLVFGLKSIDESREKYRETLEVFFQAAKSEALNYEGKFYQYRDAEVQVKPVQKPYPPLWFPSSNRESIEFTAKHGYHTAFLGRTADCKPHFDRYRELWAKHRGDAGRHNAHVAEPFLARTHHIVIAENDEEANRAGRQAHKVWSDHIHHLTRKAGRPPVHNTDPDSPDSAHPLIAGSPTTVLARLQEMAHATGINYMLCVFSFGDLAPAHAVRSLELFAKEVMPTVEA